MIDPDAEHDESDALSLIDLVERSNPADDSAGQVAGDLDDSVPGSIDSLEHNQIALVMFASVVAKSSSKFAWSVLDSRNLARHGRAVQAVTCQPTAEFLTHHRDSAEREHPPPCPRGISRRKRAGSSRLITPAARYLHCNRSALFLRPLASTITAAGGRFGDRRPGRG